MLTRRAAIAAPLLAPAIAHAQFNRPIRLIIPFAPGGTSDILARLMAPGLGATLGQPVIVENRTGAGGRLMVEAVKAARPDGDTLMFVPQGPMTLFPFIYKALRFDPFRDFTPIGRVCTLDYALTTGPATPARTLAEYLAWARVDANKAAYGSPGAGTVPHFIGQGLAQKAGVPLTHVPYRGAAPSMADLLGGNLSLVVSPLPDAIEHHRSGKARVLATSGEQRSDALAGVPTLKEAGVDLVVDGWYGLYAPAGLAAERQMALNQALGTAVGSMRDALARGSMRPAPTTPEQLTQIARRESALWEQLVKASGFNPED